MGNYYGIDPAQKRKSARRLELGRTGILIRNKKKRKRKKRNWNEKRNGNENEKRHALNDCS